MAQTSISSATAFITNQEFVDRYDVRTIGDLLSDLGVRFASGTVVNSTVLTQFAAEASGEIEAMAYMGERYKREDLAALTGNSLAYLKRLTADKMLSNMLNRRPDPTRPIPPNVQQSLAILDKLSLGYAIFALGGAAEAGKKVTVCRTPLPLVAHSLGRLFGTVNDHGLSTNHFRWDE